jgi:hypothetical protein
VADAKKAWEDVVEEFGELGKILRERFSSEGVEPGPGAAPEDAAPLGAVTGGQPAGDGTTGAGEQEADSGDDGRRIMDALSALADAARRVGEHAGAAVNDPALREGAVRVADRLGSAITATVDEVGSGLRSYSEARRNQREQGRSGEEGPWSQAADGTDGTGSAADGGPDGEPGDGRADGS